MAETHIPIVRMANNSTLQEGGFGARIQDGALHLPPLVYDFLVENKWGLTSLYLMGAVEKHPSMFSGRLGLTPSSVQEALKKLVEQLRAAFPSEEWSDVNHPPPQVPVGASLATEAPE